MPSSRAIDELLHRDNQWAQLSDTLHRLYMVGTSPKHAVHAVVYKHPITRRSTMLVHLGITSSFLELSAKHSHLEIGAALKMYEASQSPQRRQILKVYDRQETRAMLDKIGAFIEMCKERKLMYAHQYEKGDLLISDNLAVLHEAVPSTQLKPQDIGLRIMDRISIGE